MGDDTRILNSVKYYYGTELKCTADLKTPECILSEGDTTKSIKSALSAVHEEVVSRSNCVISLSPDKCTALSEAYKALKVGGELYLSDVYADRVLSDEIRKHEVLWGDAKFVSATYRLFKIPKEHFAARQAIYNGGITDFEDKLKFDHQTEFKTGEVNSLDSELAAILLNSRFKEESDFEPEVKTGTKEQKDLSNCYFLCSKVDPFKYVQSGDKFGENISEGCCRPKKYC